MLHTMMMMMRSTLLRRSIGSLSHCRSLIPIQCSVAAQRNESELRWFSDKGDSEKVRVNFASQDDDADDENTTSSPPPSDMDLSIFTEHVPIRMPDMGESKAKVVKWYKKEGDLVRYNDMLCDIETDEFTFGMVNEDDVDALMGEISVPENSDPIDDGDLLCTLLHPKEPETEKGSDAKESSSS